MYRHHLHRASRWFYLPCGGDGRDTRLVLSWRLSNTLEGHFCIEAFEDSLTISSQEIFTTVQRCQFTEPKFTSVLEGHPPQEFRTPEWQADKSVNCP